MLIHSICHRFSEMGLNISDLAFEDAFRLGKNNGNRPVIIKFIASRYVKTVFYKVRELRARNLFITNDHTKEERKQRHQLLESSCHA